MEEGHKILLLTTCTDEKYPDVRGIPERRIEREMKERYGFPKIPGRDAYKKKPDEEDSPYALKAEDMYIGLYDKIRRFVDRIRRSHEVDVFFISGGYRIVKDDELIYNYECVVGSTRNQRTVKPEDIAPAVLERLDKETQNKNYDTVIVTLSTDYYDTLSDSGRTLWHILEKNLNDPYLFIIGAEAKRGEATEICENLDLEFEDFGKNSYLIPNDPKRRIKSHLGLYSGYRKR